MPVRLSELGQLVATPGVLDVATNDQRIDCLGRHIRGDWGVVCAEDRKMNFEALRDGFRILSAYPLDLSKPSAGYGDNPVWIITEADWSVTTFLLPGEY